MRELAMLLATAALATATAPLAEQLGTATAGSPEVVLKAAINRELVTGDTAAAIGHYRAMANDNSATAPAVAAQALVQLAASYERLGRPEARATYEEILQRFPEQRPAVTLARSRLGHAQSPAPGVNATLTAIANSNVVPGTVSSDGRLLSYTSWEDGEVHVRDVRSGADRILTKRGDHSLSLSAISRDGKWVAYGAFASGCGGAAHAVAALCLVSMEGHGSPPPRTLFSHDEIDDISPMDWSPDGRHLAVAVRRRDRSMQIALVSVADGTLRVLHSVEWRGPTRIFFSPDGRDLAFDLPPSDASDHRDILLLAVDGRQRVLAVQHPSINIPMGWTPDGDTMLFASDRGGSIGLFGQPVRERRPHGEPRVLRGNIGGGWSSGVTEGGALYFSVRGGDRDVYVTTLDLAGGLQITPPTRPIQRYVGTNLFPAWSHDGRSLAYVSQRGFQPVGNDGRMVGIRSVETGEERHLYPRLEYFGPIQWSPDDRTLLATGRDLKGRFGAYTIDARTGAVSMVVQDGSEHQWTPDGRRIIYRSGPRDQFKEFSLVERDLASGVERTIARGPFVAFSVSPDGRFIAAHLADIEPGIGYAVVEVRVDSGQMRDLLRAGPSERFAPYVAPQWTPDGQAVIVRKRTPNEVWFVPTGGGAPRKLDVDGTGWSLGWVGQFSIHPDGRRVAYVSGALSSEVMVLEHFLPGR